jgi:hypothetical protein
VSSQTGAFVGVSQIGASGLPTTATAATLLFPLAVDAGATDAAVTTAISPYAFAAFDLDSNVTGIDRMYVADDPSSATGGIQKWTFDGVSWTRAAVFDAGIAVNTGFLGLAAWSSADGSVTVLGTTTESPSRLLEYIDDGVSTAPAPVVIATSPEKTAFRGVAIAPAP